MAVDLIPYAWCCRELYPNQLIYSEHHGGKVCSDCRADQGPYHSGDIDKMVEVEP